MWQKHVHIPTIRSLQKHWKNGRLSYLEEGSSAADADHPRSWMNRVKAKYPDEQVPIIDKDEPSAHGTYGYPLRLQSVNGVACTAHRDFKEYRAECRFMRFIRKNLIIRQMVSHSAAGCCHCNPELAAMITELIGDGWKKDADELEKLLAISE